MDVWVGTHVPPTAAYRGFSMMGKQRYVACLVDRVAC